MPVMRAAPRWCTVPTEVPHRSLRALAITLSQLELAVCLSTSSRVHQVPVNVVACRVFDLVFVT